MQWGIYLVDWCECNLFIWDCCRLLSRDPGHAAPSGGGTTLVSEPVGPNPLVWEPLGSVSSASVEPIGSEVPHRSQWRTWCLWMLQGGKAAHQQTSDDDGQRGELVKAMEEEEPSLVRKTSRARLDSALMCARKQWSQ